MQEVLGEKPFVRCLSVLSCDLTSGQVLIFDETMSNDERLDALISSTSIPFAFSPIKIDDMSLVDGSMFSTLEIGDPI